MKAYAYNTEKNIIVATIEAEDNQAIEAIAYDYGYMGVDDYGLTYSPSGMAFSDDAEFQSEFIVTLASGLKVDCSEAKTIHFFDGGKICVAKDESGKTDGFVCWLEAENGGELIEVPNINIGDDLEMWLSDTRLSKDAFVELVAPYELWD